MCSCRGTPKDETNSQAAIVRTPAAITSCVNREPREGADMMGMMARATGAREAVRRGFRARCAISWRRGLFGEAASRGCDFQQRLVVTWRSWCKRSEPRKGNAALGQARREPGIGWHLAFRGPCSSWLGETKCTTVLCHLHGEAACSPSQESALSPSQTLSQVHVVVSEGALSFQSRMLGHSMLEREKEKYTTFSCTGKQQLRIG